MASWVKEEEKMGGRTDREQTYIIPANTLITLRKWRAEWFSGVRGQQISAQLWGGPRLWTDTERGRGGREGGGGGRSTKTAQGNVSTTPSLLMISAGQAMILTLPLPQSKFRCRFCGWRKSKGVYIWIIMLIITLYFQMSLLRFKRGLNLVH